MYVLRNSPLTTDKNSLPRSATAERESALQLNSFNTNNSTSVEPISKHWRKNNYNTCQSTKFNQRVLRPRSAPKLPLSEITFTRVVSQIISLSLFRCDRASIYIDKFHMTTNRLDTM